VIFNTIDRFKNEKNLNREAFIIEVNSLKKIVHRWGNATSEILLETPHSIFSTPGIEGIIGYRLQSDFAITFGDPVCPPEDASKLATAFHKHCQEKNLNIIYLITSEKFAKWAIQNQCRMMIEVAEELIFDPQHDPTIGSKASKLRNYLKHASHLGLQVHEYLTSDEHLEHSIEQVGKKWLKGRRGPQMHLGNLNFFEDRMDKRWFYVQQDKRILGMALLSKLDHQKGWFLKYLISIPEAPRGTSELLMVSIMEILRNENCRFLTYGVVPIQNLGEIVGLSKFPAFMARFGYKLTKWIFHLDQRKRFWQKFHPKTERSFALFSKQGIGIKEIRALIKALIIDI
jgi:lysylphosphatidylglycerol synthetase-like protein (DUF2156 family)